ncbi:MAG TPA: metallopeptidase family protein [Devosiaceae bacterium]
MSGAEWHRLTAPSLAEFKALAKSAYESLPEDFRAYCGEISFVVADFADDATLHALGIESEFDLLGLFHGVGMAQGAATPVTGQLPNQISLYRRPILAYWAEGDDTLGAVITHVMVHEIGHHFGFSDADLEAIEAQPDED